MQLNAVKISAQSAQNKLALAKQKLISSQKAQAGNQSVADVLSNNVDVADQANKDIDAIGDSIDQIASEEKNGTSFSLQPIAIAVGSIAAVALFTTLAVRRRRSRPSVGVSKDYAEDLDFDALLKKIRLDNLNKDIAKPTSATKKAAPRKPSVKRAVAKKSAPAKKKAVPPKKASAAKKKSTAKKIAVKKKIK